MITFMFSSNTGIFLSVGPTDPGAPTPLSKAVPPAKLPRPVTSTSTICDTPLTVSVGAASTAVILNLLAPVCVVPEKSLSNFTKSSPESMYLDKEYLSEIPRLLGVMSLGDKSMVMSSPMIRPFALAISSTSRREMACLGLVISVANKRPVVSVLPEIAASRAMAALMSCSDAVGFANL